MRNKIAFIIVATAVCSFSRDGKAILIQRRDNFRISDNARWIRVVVIVIVAIVLELPQPLVFVVGLQLVLPLVGWQQQQLAQRWL